MDLQSKLLLAVLNENLSAVTNLLRAGANPNFYYNLKHADINGSLMHLTESGKIAEELLRHGALVDRKDWCGSTPLLRAVERGCVDLVKVLLKNDASIIMMNGLGDRVLPCAIRCYNGNMDIIKILINHGANVNGGMFSQSPPLHIAVMSNKLEVIEELIKEGASLERRDDRDLTALHLALHQSDVKASTIKKLLELGANSNAEYSSMQYPLDFAIMYRSIDIVRELLNYGANVCTEDQECKSTLFKAVTHYNSVNAIVIQELLNYGAQAGSYAPDLIKQDDIVVLKHSPVLYAVHLYSNDCSIPSWVNLLIKYSTIDYLEIYVNYSTTEMTDILGTNLCDYAISCITEVSWMQRELVDSSKSLYDYIKLYIKKEISLADIDTAVTAKIFAALINNDFPIYQDIIVAIINRNYLLQKISEERLFTFSRGSKKISLVSDTIYPIAKYLSNTDLLNFLLANHGVF